MPAAAVIPAGLVYTYVVAVKKLVVGLNTVVVVRSGCELSFLALSCWRCVACIVYCEKIRVFKACLLHLNTLAWNNKI